MHGAKHRVDEKKRRLYLPGRIASRSGKYFLFAVQFLGLVCTIQRTVCPWRHVATYSISRHRGGRLTRAGPERGSESVRAVMMIGTSLSFDLQRTEMTSLNT